jgi:hypothetical protein
MSHTLASLADNKKGSLVFGEVEAVVETLLYQLLCQVRWGLRLKRGNGLKGERGQSFMGEMRLWLNG